MIKGEYIKQISAYTRYDKEAYQKPIALKDKELDISYSIRNGVR